MPLVSANSSETYSITRIGGTPDIWEQLEDPGFRSVGTL